MEDLVAKQLLEEYISNSESALALAELTVSNIEIPVFNTLSTLSRQNMLQLLNILGAKFKQMSSSTVKNMMLTLITDVLTSVIKYNDFYESFEGNNAHLIQTLCKKIIQISRVRIDEFEALQSHVKQMTKYSARIPEYIQLKYCLNGIQNIASFRNNYIDGQMVNRKIRTSKFMPRQLQFTDANENILKEKNGQSMLTKRMYSDTKSESIKYVCKPNNEITQNNIESLDIESKIAFHKIDQNYNQIETKTTNKYFVLKPNNENTQNNNKFLEIKPKIAFDKTEQNCNQIETKTIKKYFMCKPNNKITQSNIKIHEIKPKIAFDKSDKNYNPKETKIINKYVRKPNNEITQTNKITQTNEITQTNIKLLEIKPKIDQNYNQKEPKIINKYPGCKPNTEIDQNYNQKETKSINKYFECKTYTGITQLKLKPKIDQINNKLPEAKHKNAFDVLMSSAKNKGAKKMKFL